MKEKSIVGDLINFRGLVYAPVNENGVIFLFGKVADDLNMYIEEIKPGFPDCVARRFVGKGWEKIAIEFEYKSSSFKVHDHDKNGCDVIVCWEHDWTDCPIEVIELKSEIQGLKNPPIRKPGATEKQEKDVSDNLNQLFTKMSASASVRKWYDVIFEKVSEIDDEIWAKIGTKYIGWYCPERAFVSLRIQKTSLFIECFSGGMDMPETKVVSSKHAPRWVKFTVKSDSDVDKVIGIIKESYARIKKAIAAGEATGYFSGGEPFNSAVSSAEEN